MKQRTTFYLATIVIAMLFLLSTTVSVAQLISETEIQFTNSSGEKVFTYKTGDMVYVKLVYPAKNVDATMKETVYAKISSEVEKEGEIISLVETGVSSGIFKGNIKIRVSPMPFPNSSFVEVDKGDKLEVRYKLPENDKGIEEQIFDNAYYRGPEWTFVNTGSNHIVLLAPDIQILIDGKPAEKGIFVSAYYDKVVDGKKIQQNAGGTGKDIAPAGVRWNGQVTALAVWGSQEGKNNGFSEGETFKWKIWRPSDGKVYDAVATYITNDPRISHGDTYTKDGISGLIKLEVKTK